jgi:hypothetical protein
MFKLYVYIFKNYAFKNIFPMAFLHLKDILAGLRFVIQILPNIILLI